MALQNPDSSCVGHAELVLELIARWLPSNVVACSLRLVNKATSILLKDYKIIHLSQPIPEHFVTKHFSAPESALRPFSKTQRLQLLTSVSASGSLSNLTIVLKATEGYLTGEDPRTSDESKLWHALKVHGGYDTWDLRDLVLTAAAAGHGCTCRWLLDAGCPGSHIAVACAAAHGGHPVLARELYTQGPHDNMTATAHVAILEATADGCSLPVLQELYNKIVVEMGLPLEHAAKRSIVSCALVSRTPDWRAKVDWLEAAHSFPRPFWPTSLLSSAWPADAAARLAWMRGRGTWLGSLTLVAAAAGSGSIASFEYLLNEQVAASGETDVPGYTAGAAAVGGHLAVLQLLHSRGCRFNVIDVLRQALAGGHAAVAAWLVETYGVGQPELRRLRLEAVRSGSLELVCWMDQQVGFGDEEWAVDHAIDSGGSEELVEWLVGRGCPLKIDVDQLARNQHMGMLRCLHRLGWRPQRYEVERLADFAMLRICSRPALRFLCSLVPLGGYLADAATFTRWALEGASLSSLRWLVEEAGCPVDWKAALNELEPKWQKWDRAVIEWIRRKVRKNKDARAQEQEQKAREHQGP